MTVGVLVTGEMSPRSWCTTSLADQLVVVLKTVSVVILQKTAQSRLQGRITMAVTPNPNDLPGVLE